MNPQDIFKLIQQDNQLRTAQAKLEAAYRAGDCLVMALLTVADAIPDNEVAQTIIRANIERWKAVTIKSNSDA
jgi:hypothetical protein